LVPGEAPIDAGGGYSEVDVVPVAGDGNEFGQGDDGVVNPSWTAFSPLFVYAIPLLGGFIWRLGVEGSGGRVRV